MKVRKLIKRYYIAIFENDVKKQKKLYDKITRKSLDHKKTYAIK